MGQGLDALLDLDAKLVEAAQRVKVLSSLEWPDGEADKFLAGWRKGKAKLPSVAPQKADHGDAVAELTALAKKADGDDPLARYVARTARSYAMAGRMLMAAGTPEFKDLSCELYGQPSDHVGPEGLTALDAAEHFVKATEELARSVPREDETIPAAQVQKDLQQQVDAFFADQPVKVVLDAGLSAKAAAGADRIRLRSSCAFSTNDVPQLLHHEALVHSLTLKNGRLQPRLKSLGLGAPRTTSTQEGLATLAELLTSTIDLSRLRRLALRVLAIHRALHGADFIDVFRFFLESGHSEPESFHSAQRIFRGGDVRGRVAFTKDGVYLQGLISTHSFLRKAIQSDKPRLVHMLFAGRLTLGDAVELEPYFESGVIAPPRFEPPWVKNRHTLAATLAFSVFTGRIDLEKVRMEDFVAHDR